MHTGPGIYCLDLLPSMAAVHSWFYTDLFKPAGLKPFGPPALEDDYYKVEAILQINKHGTHSKVKWIGYDSFHNQWIKLFELKETASKSSEDFKRDELKES